MVGFEHTFIADPTEESKTAVKLSSFFVPWHGHRSRATLQELRSKSLSSNTRPRSQSRCRGCRLSSLRRADTRPVHHPILQFDRAR